MFSPDVALVVLLALVFGFVNGWVLNRQIFRGGASVGEPPEFSLAVERSLMESESESKFPLEAAREAQAEHAVGDVPLRTPSSDATTQVTVEELSNEARSLRARIQLLEPLVDQIRERDALIADLNRAFDHAVAKHQAHTEFDNARRAELAAAVRDLHAHVEAFEADIAEYDARVESAPHGVSDDQRGRDAPGARNSRGHASGARSSPGAATPERARLRKLLGELRQGVSVAQAVVGK